MSAEVFLVAFLMQFALCLLILGDSFRRSTYRTHSCSWFCVCWSSEAKHTDAELTDDEDLGVLQAV